jgi:sialidase-1
MRIISKYLSLLTGWGFLSFIFFMNFDPADAQEVQNESLQAFLGTTYSNTLQLWEGNEGRPGSGIATMTNGNLIAYKRTPGSIRFSDDGGLTWSEENSPGEDISGSKLVIDDTNGDILFVDLGENGAGQVLRSSDSGQTWDLSEIEIHPDGFGYYPDSLAGSQPGITLKFNELRGRLILPGMVMGPEGSGEAECRPYHYSNVIYSDDHGETWQTSKLFPVLGTMGGAVTEIHDGSIIYNAREFMSKGNRFIAWSNFGGDLWLNAYRSETLPDGPAGSSFGCPGGMIRLPIEGHDILIYSNLDTESGSLPATPGDLSTEGRENLTLWVSFDGGKTWPLKRLVQDGPAGSSCLSAGRTGTPGEGKIYLLYEGGPAGNEGIHLSVFNLSWILDGKAIEDYLEEEYALWTVYDGSRVLTDYEEWSVETKGTPPPDGTCYTIVDDPLIQGNKLIKMEDLTDNWKEALQLNWGINHMQGVTIVFRSRPTEDILNLQTSAKEKKLVYASPRNGTYFDALVMEETAAKSGEYNLKLNQAAGFSTPVKDFGWLIYRLTMKEDSLKVYLNETSEPYFSAQVPEKGDNFFQFGNNARAPFGAYFDWMAIYYNGAYAPGEGEDLPEKLTGLQTFILELEIEPPGAGQASGEGEFLVGQQVNLNASSYEGYEFDNWSVNGEVISHDSVYPYLMPFSDIVLAANFRPAGTYGNLTRPIKDHIEIYPNPAHEKVLVHAEPGTLLSVYNSAGRKLSAMELPGPGVEMDVRDFPAGLYILKFDKENEVCLFKLIINEQ